MNAIDITSLIIIFFCSASAFFKGAFGELISLASLSLGYFLYRAAAPYVLSSINIGFPFSIIFDIILMAVSIFIVSFILHHATHKIRQEYSSASSDMLAGMALGAVKGYVIVVIIFSLLFDLFTDKQVFTGEMEEREGVPAFLYRARSYNFLRDSYVAFNPVMKKIFAAMQHRDEGIDTTDDAVEQVTEMDTLLQRTRQQNIQRYGGDNKPSIDGQTKTPDGATNETEGLQIKINDYTVNIDPKDRSLNIESNKTTNMMLLKTLGFGKDQRQIQKNTSIEETTQPELTNTDLEDFNQDIPNDADISTEIPEADIEEILPQILDSNQAISNTQATVSKSSTTLSKGRKVTKKSKAKAKQSKSQTLNQNNYPGDKQASPVKASNIDDIINRELKR